VRFLIDNALSPAVDEALASAGHDAVHVRSLRMHADSGRRSASPSVILFRHGSQHRPADQATLLEATCRNSLPLWRLAASS
jgi:hypothetical protein